MSRDYWPSGLPAAHLVRVSINQPDRHHGPPVLPLQVWIQLGYAIRYSAPAVALGLLATYAGWLVMISVVLWGGLLVALFTSYRAFIKPTPVARIHIAYTDTLDRQIAERAAQLDRELERERAWRKRALQAEDDLMALRRVSYDTEERAKAIEDIRRACTSKMIPPHLYL